MLYLKALVLHFQNILRLFLSSYVSSNRCLVCKTQTFSSLPLCSFCIHNFFYKPLAKRINRPSLYCKHCGIPLISEKGNCVLCKQKINEEKITTVRKQFVLYPYLNKYTDIVLKWKNEEIRTLSPFFAFLIAYFIKKTPTLKGIPIVPVPPRPKKLKTKGWDQIEDICTFLETFYSFKINHLLGRLDGHSQKGLSKKERESNLKEKIYLKKHKNIPEKIIILDDVITTGSTMKTCINVLKEAGCKIIYPLVIFFN